MEEDQLVWSNRVSGACNLMAGNPETKKQNTDPNEAT